MKNTIEKAWQGYRITCVPPLAGEEQLRATRWAFFSGAAILFRSIMSQMSGDEEPTDADMQVMTDIQEELVAFGHELDTELFKHMGVMGNG